MEQAASVGLLFEFVLDEVVLILTTSCRVVTELVCCPRACRSWCGWV